MLDQHASGTPGIHDEKGAEKEIETQEEKNGAGGEGVCKQSSTHLSPVDVDIASAIDQHMLLHVQGTLTQVRSMEDKREAELGAAEYNQHAPRLSVHTVNRLSLMAFSSAEISGAVGIC